MICQNFGRYFVKRTFNARDCALNFHKEMLFSVILKGVVSKNFPGASPWTPISTPFACNLPHIKILYLSSRKSYIKRALILHEEFLSFLKIIHGTIQIATGKVKDAFYLNENRLFLRSK